MRSPSLTLRLSVLLLSIAQPALAGDGRLEINQTCALVGCFAGDAPGFPVTLATSGSYALTGNLQVTDPNTHGIVSAARVSIDLNGFEIAGPVACTGAPLMCSPSSPASGIIATDYSSVSNGTVRGFGQWGVRINGFGAIRGVTSRGNGNTGLSATIITDSIARQNWLKGIQGTVMESCTATENAGLGLGGGIVRNSAAIGNGIGIHASLVQGSAAYLNQSQAIGASGIQIDAGGLAIDDASNDNAGAGISAESGALLGRNSVRSNGGFGLALLPGVTYRESNMTDNSGGAVSGGVNMGDNACDGSICPP